jgi:hypothetical protein
VISGDLISGSMDSLKFTFSRFQEGEVIAWLSRDWLERCWQKDFYDLSLPPEEIIDGLRQYCNENHLSLEVFY